MEAGTPSPEPKTTRLEDMGDPKGYLEMKLEASSLRHWGPKEVWDS